MNAAASSSSGGLWRALSSGLLPRRGRTAVSVAGIDLNPPPRSTPLAQLSAVAVDMETTSLDPSTGEIVSLGWVPIDQGVIRLDQAGYLLISGVDVGQSATIHLLTDEELASGVPLAEALAQFLPVLSGRALLAHFAVLESGFLAAACQRLYGVAPRLEVVDTFAMERRHMEKMATYPRGEDLRLARVRQRYGLPSYHSHNALTDALACAELFLAQLGSTQARTLGDVAKLSPTS